jgi:hypothetical protein
MSDGLWRGVVPPFRMLDPGLGDAAALLAEVWAALPDECRAARRLNEVLRATAGPPRLVRDACGWGLVVPDARGGGPAVPGAGRGGAAAALAVLVVAGGWRRLRHCRRCGAPFVDRTNGATRRGCDAHRA